MREAKERVSALCFSSAVFFEREKGDVELSIFIPDQLIKLINNNLRCRFVRT